MIEGRIIETQNVSYGKIIENVKLVMLAVLSHIAEKILFVRYFMMKLKVIETLSQYTVIYTIIIFEPTARLLPSHVQKKVLTIVDLLPVFSSRKYSSN